MLDGFWEGRGPTHTQAGNPEKNRHHAPCKPFAGLTFFIGVRKKHTHAHTRLDGSPSDTGAIVNVQALQLPPEGCSTRMPTTSWVAQRVRQTIHVVPERPQGDGTDKTPDV
jgi:hypothetical protein